MRGLRAALAILLAVMLMARGALAQDTAYIQIEAQPSIEQAQTRIQTYERTLENVNGFALGAGWYGIALGPYSRNRAEALLISLSAQGLIPRDSYVTTPAGYVQRIWPQPGAVPTEAPTPAAPVVETQAETPVAPDETPQEARASERLLTRSEREELQIALRWAGYYRSTIDAAFGRGTRRAMSDWQSANNHEDTGVLTTRQRAQLLSQYYAILQGMDMATITDARAGIRMELPLGVVRFDRYESPFAHYPSISALGARVILISQAGDRSTMNGLYEIMQTLEIVPRDGPRSRNRSSFQLIGEDDSIVSHTEVTLRDGEIKGFTLVWPAGDEERRERVLARMQRSFERVPGVLDSMILDDTAPTVDLVSGLRVRVPRLTRTGFFATTGGAVVTTLDAVAGCGRVTLGRDHDVRVAAQDGTSGLAVVVAEDGLAPISAARIGPGMARRSGEVAVAGFPYGGILGAPTLTFGEVADLRGLSGEPGQLRLEIDALPGDVGGPVLDTSGAVVGVFLPGGDGGRRLPAGVGLAAGTEAIQQVLSTAGLRADEVVSGTEMAPEDLTYLARDLTVLVNCWE